MKTSIFSILATALFLTSCAMDGASEATANVNDTYMLQGIEYYLNENEGDGAVNVDKVQPTQVYYNKTSDTANLTVNLYDGLTEYSLFTTTNTPSYRFDIDEHVKVSVPVDVKDGRIVLGEKRWDFSFSGMQKLPFEDYKTKKEYSVDPYTALVIGSGVSVEKISATYVATFIGRDSGNIVKVKGKWEGSRIIDSNIRENFTKVD